MNWQAIQAIITKDLKVITRSKGVLIPLIVVPVIMFIALPGLAALAPVAIKAAPGNAVTGLDGFIERMPVGLQSVLAGYDGSQKIILLVLVYFLAPMYLIVPLMVSSVIAADSFAGEKERKTLEALLYTPTTDWELFLAKLMTAWIPAILLALGGFLLYSLVANLAAWPTMKRIFLPNTMWLILALWVAPAVAAMGLGVTVLISSRAKGFQEAYQLGAMVVMPMLLLVVGQVTGVMYFNTGLVLLLGLFIWIVDAALLWFGGKTFQRSRLLAGP